MTRRSNSQSAVACGHEVTAAAAREVLEDGGNAFDAAVAAACAACVAEPVLCSLGGGGFLLARTAAGVRHLYELPFNARLAGLTAEEFARDILATQLGLVHDGPGGQIRRGLHVVGRAARGVGEATIKAEVFDCRDGNATELGKLILDKLIWIGRGGSPQGITRRTDSLGSSSARRNTT